MVLLPWNQSYHTHYGDIIMKTLLQQSFPFPGFCVIISKVVSWLLQTRTNAANIFHQIPRRCTLPADGPNGKGSPSKLPHYMEAICISGHVNMYTFIRLHTGSPFDDRICCNAKDFSCVIARVPEWIIMWYERWYVRLMLDIWDVELFSNEKIYFWHKSIN